MRVLDVKITCLISITANCRISLLCSIKSVLLIFSNDLLVLHSASESQRPPKLVIGIKN